jgi:hypothetical protein
VVRIRLNVRGGCFPGVQSVAFFRRQAEPKIRSSGR